MARRIDLIYHLMPNSIVVAIVLTRFFGNSMERHLCQSARTGPEVLTYQLG